MAVDSRKILDMGSTAFELRIHELEPETLVPIGDRYIVEELAVTEEVLFGSILVIVKPKPDPKDEARNPMANPEAIEERGAFPAVVVSVGSGHLLGLPDPRLAIRHTDGDTVQRVPADVPMFLEHGDVVLVDNKNRGRALRIAGRTLRVVNQIDCLIKVDLRLTRKNGNWERASD